MGVKEYDNRGADLGNSREYSRRWTPGSRTQRIYETEKKQETERRYKTARCDGDAINKTKTERCDKQNITGTAMATSSQSVDRQPSPAVVMHLMLKDAMLHLQNNGFSVVSLALKVKYPEIMNLQNITVFALDNASIFAGGHGDLSNFRFHIVPNRLLMSADLLKLPSGTTLPTLDHDQTLTITSSGSGEGQLRINYVRIKSSYVVYNLKIVVHSIFLAFPHLHPATTGTETGATDGPPPASAAVFDSSVFKSIRDHSKSVPSPKSNRFVGGQTFDATVSSDPAILKSKDTASCSASDKDCVAVPLPLKPKESL